MAASVPSQAASIVFINGQPKIRSPHNQFHLFRWLPTELRLTIYALSLPRRILTLNYNSSSNSFFSSTALPSLLSVCVESRKVAQEHYSLSFGTTSSRAKIYFNPELDTLYIPRCSEMGYDEDFRIIKTLIVEEKEVKANCRRGQEKIHTNRLEQLRSVAIDYVDAQIKRPWEAYNKASFLRGFLRLEEIILVLRDQNQPFIEEMESIPSLSSPLQSQAIIRWCDPRLPPETLLNMWWDFRQSFVTEENVLKEVCEELGKDYESFCLPAVRIREIEMTRSFY